MAYSRALGRRIAVVLASCLVLASCGSDDETATEKVTPREEPADAGVDNSEITCDGESVSVAHVSSEGSAATTYYPFHVAEGLDYFDDVGLDMDVVGVGGVGVVISAVLSGDADFGFATLPSVIQSSSEGAPLRALAPLQVGATLSIPITDAFATKLGLTEGDDVTAETLALASGMRLGTTTAGGGGHAFGRTVLEAGGLTDGKDYETVVLGDGPTMVGAFGQGQIDGFITSISQAETAIDQFGGDYLFDPLSQKLADLDPSLAPYDNQVGIVVIANQNRLNDKNSEPNRCFLTALRRAGDLVISDPQAAADGAWVRFEALYDSREAYDTMALGMPSITADTSVITEEMFEDTLTYLNATSADPVEAPYEDVVDTTLAESLGE